MPSHFNERKNTTLTLYKQFIFRELNSYNALMTIAVTSSSNLPRVKEFNSF